MGFLIRKKAINVSNENTLVKTYYESYAKQLFAYTRKNYNISEDDSWTIVYKTIYKMAEVNDNYKFENDQKQRAFVFKAHINFIRNYYRDNKSFEHKNLEVELNDFVQPEEDTSKQESIELKILNKELEKLEEWQRILLLMRGQDIPYSDISAFVNKPENQLKVYYARLKKQLLEDVNNELTKLNSITNEKQ
jgi:DNA-directed RNA polymerase specialized sigma24 family protein